MNLDVYFEIFWIFWFLLILVVIGLIDLAIKIWKWYND